MKHIINLVVGDASKDGHEQQESITITCNLSPSDLKSAYKKGAKILKVDIAEDVAIDYEDSKIKAKEWKKFSKAGMTLEKLFLEGYFGVSVNQSEANGDINIDYLSFANLWLFTASIGNPELEFSIENGNENTIHIGGYGLFLG